MQPILDLNRLQESRSWSLGRSKCSEKHEYDVQMISELRTEETFYSSGTTIRSKMRGFRDVTSYVG
jgi:hypothetical protein